MDDKKIIQAIANVSTVLRTEIIKTREELMKRVEKVENNQARIEKKIDEGFKKVNQRLEMQAAGA